MARPQSLNAAQVQVLAWIRDGCPDGVYPDGYSHRLSARALASRGLVKISGHGDLWRAELTDKGRGWTPPTAQDRASARGGRTQQGSKPEPTRPMRTNRAVTATEQADAPPSRKPTPPVVVQPLAADHDHPVVKAALASAFVKLVSDEQLERALGIVQFVADACTERGWKVEVDPEGHLTVASEPDVVVVRVSEEREKRDVYLDADIAERKYDWQRVSPSRVEVFAGRLCIEVQHGTSVQWWADRKRWTVESKLSQVVPGIEQFFLAAVERRVERRAQHERDLVAWAEAVEQAKSKHLNALNQDRASEQVAEWRQAGELRAYAQAVRDAAASTSGSAATDALEWARWLEAEATRLDPTNDPTAMRIKKPENPSPWDLSKYMPRSWTAAHPPAEPDQ